MWQSEVRSQSADNQDQNAKTTLSLRVDNLLNVALLVLPATEDGGDNESWEHLGQARLGLRQKLPDGDTALTATSPIIDLVRAHGEHVGLSIRTGDSQAHPRRLSIEYLNHAKVRRCGVFDAHIGKFIDRFSRHDGCPKWTQESPPCLKR